jgi:hypothetical protein
LHVITQAIFGFRQQALGTGDGSGTAILHVVNGGVVEIKGTREHAHVVVVEAEVVADLEERGNQTATVIVEVAIVIADRTCWTKPLRGVVHPSADTIYSALSPLQFRWGDSATNREDTPA